MIFRYGYRDSRKSNTRHTGPVCESKTQFNDVHSRYKPTSFICSVRFLLDTIRARRPLILKTKDGILMAGRCRCHSSAHQKCWGDWAPGGTYHLDGEPGCSGWRIKCLRHSVCEASENMGCDLRRCNFSTLFSLFI